MSEQDLKRIVVTIAGRTYPVKVKQTEEKVVRALEKEVNNKLNDLQLSYQGKDMQDYMSLALLFYASYLHKAKNSDDLQILEDKLNDLEKLLE